METKILKELEDFGIMRNKATLEAHLAVGLVKTDDPVKIREAIKLAGYDVVRTIYAFHKYYKYIQGHYYGAREFDERYAEFQERKVDGRR